MFAHEYAHDLGLPDDYDTRPAAAATTRVNWWTLMAQSRGPAPSDEGIGTRAADLGAWDKLQLGWLDYEVVGRGPERETLDLGPHEYNSAKAQGVVVVAAEEAGRDRSSARRTPAPSSGGRGAGDDLRRRR